MKRALLVGINKYPDSPLRGCVNDAEDVASLLVSHFSFAPSDIRLVVDKRATKKAILSRLGWLVDGTRPGDRVVFHFSGHGVQLPTRNPQGEVDGLDEAICPVEFDWSDETTIRDKELALVFSALPAGVRLTWISDSCHSGDLSRNPSGSPKAFPMPADFRWRRRTAEFKQLSASSLSQVVARGGSGEMILITGCKSDQVSMDATFGNRPNGALTYFLVDSLKKEDARKEPIKDVVAKVKQALNGARFEQVPQLEGSKSLMDLPAFG